MAAPTSSRALRLMSRSNYVCTRCSQFSTSVAVQSGHNRWSKIKHDKAGVDKKKNQERSIFSRDIELASKLGGPDPAQNPQLHQALTLAKKAGFPKASQEAAIARGQGRSAEGKALENMIIEAIIPPQAAMIVDIETDSKLRTLQDVRHTIKRNGGTITPTAYLFKRKGRVVLEADERKLCPDDVLDEVIEAGAEDVEMDYAGNLVVWTEPADTVAAARSLSSALKAKVASSDIIWDPNEDTMVPMTKEEDFDALNKIVEALQEDSTIQGIYVNVTNGGIPEEKWAELAEKIPV